MIKLTDLPQAAQDTLGGLQAGPALLNCARMAAQQGADRPHLPRPLMPRLLAFSMAAVMVLLGVFTILPTLNKQDVPPVFSQAAGEPSLSTGRMSADLPRGSLVLSQDTGSRDLGVWARGSAGNFPLLRVNDRFYRLLNNPKDASSLAGSQVTQVAVFTEEPALDTQNAALSNTAPLGSAIFSAGKDSAILLAPVEGTLRAFQRVAFAGSALLGGESLSDTLPAGQVAALQINGIGAVTEASAVQELMNTLLTQARYQGGQTVSGNTNLLIQYESGLTVQFAVRGDSLGACGTWACPAFLEAFRAAVQH